nr:MAK10-like protein [Tanacetum cinerariifolium]
MTKVPRNLGKSALYDNKSWNDPRDLAKLVKSISLPQDVPSTSDCRLVELENQVQPLMEAHIAPKPSVQVNKNTSSCEIYGGPHDTRYCMENPKQAFVDYGITRPRVTMEWEESQLSRLVTQLKKQQDEVINKINTSWKVVSEKLDNAPTRDIVKNSMVYANVVSHDHQDSEAIPNKGIIKIPSKLFSHKCQAHHL